MTLTIPINQGNVELVARLRLTQCFAWIEWYVKEGERMWWWILRLNNKWGEKGIGGEEKLRVYD